jgi:uncharacterized protein YqeY
MWFSRTRPIVLYVMTDADGLRAALRNDLTAAMKTRDADTITALRTAIAAIENAEAVEAAHHRGAPTNEHFAGAQLGVGAAEAPRRDLTIDDLHEILRDQVRERTEVADRYETLGAADAAARLRREADALRKYLVD